MATLVNQGQDKYEITVDATGAATKHIVDMAKGNEIGCQFPVFQGKETGLEGPQQLGDDRPGLVDQRRTWIPGLAPRG